MGRKLSGSELVRRVGELAFGNSNDAVKLVFLNPEEQGQIDGLDLRMVSEVKRGGGGNVEVKLLNRIALLELLAGLLDDTKKSAAEGGEAESFFTAMDKAAASFRETER